MTGFTPFAVIAALAVVSVVVSVYCVWLEMQVRRQHKDLIELRELADPSVDLDKATAKLEALTVMFEKRPSPKDMH